MHLALCDDDAQALTTLVKLVEEYRAQHCPGLSYHTFSNPLLLSEQMEKTHFDLLILDVVMPQQSGIELAADIRSWNSHIPIIFLTTAPEFAVTSYRVQAQDYLLKPVKQRDFFASLHRQIQHLIQQERRILLHTVRGMLQIPISSIIYIEAVSRKLVFVMTDGTTAETTDTIHDMEHILMQYPQFTRPHRSYLVNLHHVKGLEKEGLYTTNGAFIPISRGNMGKLKRQYINTLLLDEQGER